MLTIFEETSPGGSCEYLHTSGAPKTYSNYLLYISQAAKRQLAVS